jgi:hypothetical protein
MNDMAKYKLLFSSVFDGQVWEIRLGMAQCTDVYAAHINCLNTHGERHSEAWSWLLEDTMSDEQDQTTFWCHYCRAQVPDEIQALAILYDEAQR